MKKKLIITIIVIAVIVALYVLFKAFAGLYVVKIGASCFGAGFLTGMASLGFIVMYFKGKAKEKNE